MPAAELLAAAASPPGSANR